MTQQVLKLEAIDKDSAALLIIDMQNDFIHDDGYFGKVAKEIGYDMEFRKQAIQPVRTLTEVMRQLGVTVIYCQTMWLPDRADVGVVPTNLRRAKEKGIEFGIKGSWGAQIIEELKPQKGDYVVECKCYGKFQYTPLELILRNKGIKTLIFTGVGSNVCVETTLREAVGRGFQVIMTSDGTRAKDRETHEAALKGIAFTFGPVMTCEEVIELLGKE